MSVIVLFGAGASAYSGSTGDACPPVGEHLMTKLAERPGSIAAQIVADSDLKTAFDRHFEDGMDLLDQRAKEYLSEHLSAGREVPRDGSLFAGGPVTALLAEVAIYLSEFLVSAGNAYVAFAHLMRKSAPVSLATLNYETMLDQALERVDIPIKYHLGDDSVPYEPARRPAASLLKLHGAVNIVPDIDGVLTIIGNIGLGAMSIPSMEAPARIESNLEKVRAKCRESRLPPAISHFARSKQTPVCPATVAKQHQLWREALTRFDRLIVVGAGYWEVDRHVWDPVVAFKGALTWVNPKRDSFAKLNVARSCAGADTARDEHVVCGFREALPEIARVMTDR